MDKRSFPEGFILGTATASYQIEGAVLEDGRGASIWDTFSHTPGNIFGGHTGDIACDHYHRFKTDVGLMKELGTNGYRFSIAWSRIFPSGRGKPNQRGLDFYDGLVDALLENGIDPMATLYHWDLPQALQDSGGWSNRDIADYFAEYAGCVMEKLGDRVKKWNTLNEPWVSAFAGHYLGRHAPGLVDFRLALQVSHHLLLSHAKAVEVYRQLNQGGKVGIALNLYPTYPATSSPEDLEAARRADGYHNRWFLDPIYKGRYPEDMESIFRERFGAPVVMPGDMELMKANTIDFLGINYYFRMVIRNLEGKGILDYEQAKPEGDYTDMGWEIYPQGMLDLLRRIQKDYDDPHIMITENGAAFGDERRIGGVIQDDDRIQFLRIHLEAAEKALQEDIKLDGYYIWSLLDNFEWGFGYSKRFGLFYTDYESLERIWKKSGLWLKEFIRENGIKSVI